MAATINRHRGFSLLEMLVYIAFLSMLLIVVVQTVLAIGISYRNVIVARNIEQSAVVSLERLSRDIRSAVSIDVAQSVLGAHPGRLDLSVVDDLGVASTLDAYVENGILKIKKNGVYQGPVSLSNTAISSLIFRQITTPNSQGVKIELQITGTSGSITRERPFYSTAVFRNSY